MSNWSLKYEGPIIFATGSDTGSYSGDAFLYFKTDGNLYAKTSNNTNVQVTGLSGGGVTPIIREYTANDTWYKPSPSSSGSLYGIFVICLGAGGGGGSGRRSAVNIAASGGSGGSGAGFASRFILASNLDTSASIVIGSGGNGAQGVDTDSTSGANGNSGGNTEFGLNGSNHYVLAVGGLSGAGGALTALGSRPGGSSASCIPAYGPRSINGAIGGSTSVSIGTGGEGSDGLRNTGGAGGGGGGGIRTTNVSGTGGAGGAVWENGIRLTLPAGGTVGAGTANGESGTGPAYDSNYVLFDASYLVTTGVGSGGAGGAASNSTTNVAGNGGNGGIASGGGGGGAARNTGGTGFPTGNGGNGGNGICYVIEFYGA